MPNPFDFVVLNLDEALEAEFGPPHPVAGILPAFLSSDDHDDAVTQINKNYAHGGGWHDFDGFTMRDSADGAKALHYPGDPPMAEIWRTKVRDETVILFQCGWVAVVQPDGTHRIAHID